jgi:outer membrane protein
LCNIREIENKMNACSIIERMIRINIRGDIVRIKTGIYVLLVMSLLVSGAWAQEYAKKQEQDVWPKAGEDESTWEITLGDAISISLEKNLELMESSNQVETSKVALQQKKHNFLPDLTLSASGSKRSGARYDQLKDRIEDTTSDVMNTDAKSSLTLFNGFENVAGLAQARFDLNASKGYLKRQKEYTIFETISRFLQAVMYSELVSIEKENLTTQQNQLDKIEEFFKYGKRPVTDVLQQRADIAQAELNVVNVERDFAISKMNLLEIMGVRSDRDISLIQPRQDTLIQNLLDSSSEITFESVLANRADFQAQKMQIESAREEVRVAKSGYWPSLDLSLSAGSNYNSENEYLEFSEQYYDLNPYESAGLYLTIPVFDQYRTKHNVKQARIRLYDQELALEKRKIEIQNELQKARLDLQTAIKQRESAQAQLEYASEALKAAEARYDLGFITYVELSQMRAEKMSASYNRVDADYNLLIKGMAVKYYQGEIEELVTWFE